MSDAQNEHSVTHWIAALKQDHSMAGQRLWEQYVEKLARLAHRKLGRLPRRAVDEDDVVAEPGRKTTPRNDRLARDRLPL